MTGLRLEIGSRACLDNLMPCKICVIGLGGSGNKIVERMSGVAQEGVSIVAVNTDASALEDSKASMKIQIAPSMTRGLGAGGDPDVGRRAAQEDIVKLTALCMDTHLVILVTGLGGGTGTGGAPVILDAAKQAGALTLCFATLPFGFEGGQRKAQAERAVPLLSKVSDALVMVPNDRLSESTRKPNVSDSFDMVNDILAKGVASIVLMLSRPAYLNLDFSNLQKVIQSGGGMCTFGYGYGEGDDRARDALNELLNSPLLDGGAVIKGARSLLVSIVGGKDLALQSVGDVMNSIKEMASCGCNVSMGTVVDDGWDGKMGVTVVASEQWTPAGEDDAGAEDGDVVRDGFDELVTDGREGGGPAVRTKPGRKKKKAEKMQEKLTLQSAGRDRFKGAVSSVMEGEDWDIPTFIRRRIKLGK